MRVTLASLNTTTDRTKVSSLHKVRLGNVKGKKVARHTFVAQGKVRNATKVGGLNYILKFLSCTSNRSVEEIYIRVEATRSRLDLID